MHRDLFDLGLQILILILPKERTFSLLNKKKKKEEEAAHNDQCSLLPIFNWGSQWGTSFYG